MWTDSVKSLLQKAVNTLSNIPWGEMFAVLKNLPWDKIIPFFKHIFSLPLSGGRRMLLKAFDFVRKIPFGMLVYAAVAATIVCSIFPKEGGGVSNVTGGIIAIILCVVVTVFFFVINNTKTTETEIKESPTTEVKTGDKGKKEDDKKNDEAKKPPKPTFWFSIESWIMIIVALIFFSTAIEMNFFSGPIINIGDVLQPAVEKMYVPIFGIIVAIFGFLLVVLMTENCEPIVEGFGTITGVILWLFSIFCFWFMPFDKPHDVYFPLLKLMGLSPKIIFPADPQFHVFYIAGCLVAIFIALPLAMPPLTSKLFPRLDPNMIRMVIILIAAVMFGEQAMFYK